MRLCTVANRCMNTNCLFCAALVCAKKATMRSFVYTLLFFKFYSRCYTEPYLLQERGYLHPGEFLRLSEALYWPELRARRTCPVSTDEFKSAKRCDVQNLTVWFGLLSFHRNCGVIPHGEWVQKGCSYCRCGYGMLHCFPQVFHSDCGKGGGTLKLL